jgi:gamma-glutamylcyclotransferase (GGCT)/AIG2-like uncharacterized protein YtfP
MKVVFVYGTLKRGHGNHVLLKDSDFLGPAITEDKFIMYQSGVPFVSKHHNMVVISGEAYKVDELTLNRLDMLEGHPTWYKREETPIKYINREGKIINTNAWLYFCDDIPSQAEVITTGIYGFKKNNRFRTLL